MGIMISNEYLWGDHYHISYFLPNADLVESNFVSLIIANIVEHPQSHVLLKGIDSEGNLCNIN